MSTYDVSDDEQGMNDAVDRVRKAKRGKDVFGVLNEQPNHIEEAVKSLEKEQPEAGLKSYAPAPQFGPVEPPPKEPPSVAPAPEAPPEQPFKPNDMPVQTSAAPAAAPDANPKLTAISDLRSMIDRMGAGGGDAPGLGDADIAAAQGRDRAQAHHDNFTRAISAGLLRQPYNPVEPREGTDLLQRRALQEQKLTRQSSAQEKLIAALKGEKDPGSLSEFQKYEMDRNSRLDTEKSAAAHEKSAAEEAQLGSDRQNFGKELTALGLDPTKASQKDIDRAMSLKNAEATQSLARAQFGDKQQQEAKKATEGIPVNMELAEGANPAPEQLKDLGVVDRGADEVHKLSNRMREVLARSSRLGRVMPTDDRRLLTQLQGEMTVALKDSAKLGQISAGDQALIDSIRPDATGADSLLRDPASFEKQLRGMERYADDKRSTAMKSLGTRYKAGNGGPAAPPPIERPASVPPNAKFINGKWMYRKDDGSVEVFEAGG